MLCSDYLTTGDVARVLDCAPRSASKMFDQGIVPGFRLPTGGGDRRICRKGFIKCCIEWGVPLDRLAKFLGASAVVMSQDGKFSAKVREIVLKSLGHDDEMTEIVICDNLPKTAIALSQQTHILGVWIDFRVGREASISAVEHFATLPKIGQLTMAVEEDESRTEELKAMGKVIARDPFVNSGSIIER